MGIRNQLLTAGALMAGFAVSGGAQADTWLKDAISGCAVWNDQPPAQEIVSWSGACADGKASGDGVLVVVKDGRLYVRYDGPMVAGKATGVGKVEYQTEAGYVTYWGQLEGSMLKGQGFLRRPDGGLYAGGFDKDEPEGRGTYTAADGAYYQGEFKAGEPHGMGSDRTATGEQYTGQYVDGRRHGTGQVTFADGDRYEGSFANGEPDGTGRWQGSDGDVYEGEFRLGEAAGKGKYTSPGGDVYEGTFVANLPDGTMQVTRADGTREQQTWKDGKAVE